MGRRLRAALLAATTITWIAAIDGSARAEAPTAVLVVSYDIAQSPRSGWGCWTHAYTGSIADTGRTVSGSVVCTPDGNRIANYSGGSGTLNDGVIDTATSSDTHLFALRAADDGQPIRPHITPKFSQAVFIDTITVHGGDNIFSGGIDSATIHVGTAQAIVAATPSGTPNAIGVPRDDVFDLTNTPLSTISTTEVTLSDFVTTFFGAPFDQLAVAEITVVGRVAATPIDVDLDVRPAVNRNVISLASRIPVPVAVYSSPTLTVATVDVATLTFGHSGDEDSILGCLRVRDINRDHQRDLLCLVDVSRTGFVLGDVEGILKGRTINDEAIEGSDTVVIRS